jgi:hypothetical protein
MTRRDREAGARDGPGKPGLGRAQTRDAAAAAAGAAGVHEKPIRVIRPSNDRDSESAPAARSPGRPGVASGRQPTREQSRARLTCSGPGAAARKPERRPIGWLSLFLASGSLPCGPTRISSELEAARDLSRLSRTPGPWQCMSSESPGPAPVPCRCRRSRAPDWHRDPGRDDLVTRPGGLGVTVTAFHRGLGLRLSHRGLARALALKLPHWHSHGGGGPVTTCPGHRDGVSSLSTVNV